MESQLHKQAVKGGGTMGIEAHNIHDFDRYKKRTEEKFQQRKGTKAEENVKEAQRKKPKKEDPDAMHPFGFFSEVYKS